METLLKIKSHKRFLYDGWRHYQKSKVINVFYMTDGEIIKN